MIVSVIKDRNARQGSLSSMSTPSHIYTGGGSVVSNPAQANGEGQDEVGALGQWEAGLAAQTGKITLESRDGLGV